MIAICSRIGDRLKSMNLSVSEIDWKGDEFVSIGRLCPNIFSITFDDIPPELEYCPFSIRFDSFDHLKELRFPSNIRCTSIHRCLNSIPQSIEILAGVRGQATSTPIYLIELRILLTFPQSSFIDRNRNKISTFGRRSN